VQENPYAATLTAAVPEPPAGSDESIRNAHLKHETNTKTVGGFFLIGFIISLLILVELASISVTQAFLPILVVLAICSALLATGIGVYKLSPWARISGIVLAAIGLLGFPLVTLISIYTLWVLLSKKGRTVFSADYARVIAATPHIRYRTSTGVKIALGILLAIAAVILGMLAWSLSGG
jgi:hypothetical protein